MTTHVSTSHLRAIIGQRLAKLITHIILVIASFIVGLPFLWMITTSLKSDTEVGLFPPIWFPEVLQWHNYIEVWNAAPFGQFYINSIITTVSGLVLEVIIGTLSAYAFARVEFPHRDALFMVVLATMMIPGEMALVPNFLTMRLLGWINTYQGIVVPYISSALGCFLLRQAFLAMPQDLFDAAKIDGAGHLRILTSVAAPMARPAIFSPARTRRS